MFGEMSQTGVMRFLVSRSHVVEHVQRHHLRGGVVIVQQSETVREHMPVDTNHALGVISES